jgi:ubiquinone/menaquinone biosynthesis C-methylase UbiE
MDKIKMRRSSSFREPANDWCRLTPAILRFEHLHRYAIACEYVRGKDVLDIASGQGYGSFLLSEVAANVAGVDISSEVIAHARDRYRDKITFAVGSQVTIPVSSGSIDPAFAG